MELSFYLGELYQQEYGQHISPKLAKLLVDELPVTDGSKRGNGEKWNYETAVKFGNNEEIDWHCVNKGEFYLILNKFYSMFYSVAKKFGINDYEFYSEMAGAWFNDVDAAENRTFNLFFA